MLLAKELRASVLQEAIRGNLSEHFTEYTAADTIIAEASFYKNKWIEEKKTKRDKALPELTDEEIPFEIPQTWKWVRLSDICNITDGTHQTPTYVKKGIPFISAQNVKPFAFDENVYALVSEKDHREYNKVVSPARGDILMTRVGAGIGEAAIVTADYDFSIYVSVALIKSYIPEFDMNYILCVLNSPYGREYAERKTLGKKASQGNYNLGFIREFPIPLPPLEEQKQICKRVFFLLQKIREYEMVEHELDKLEKDFPEDLRNSILSYAFQGRLTEHISTYTPVTEFVAELSQIRKCEIEEIDTDDYILPARWTCLKLTDIADIYTGNSISEAIKKLKYVGLENGYPYIATKDVSFSKEVDYENGVKIPFEEDKFKYAFKDATLLCIEGGSAGKKIALIDRQVCFGNKLCAFNPVLINKHYLYYYLQSPLFCNIFMDEMTGLIGGVSINKIRRLSIPIPPIEEQIAIVDKLRVLLSICDKVKI